MPRIRHFSLRPENRRDGNHRPSARWGSKLALIGGLWLLPVVLRAATFSVTTTADSGAGSFRQAILDANAASDLDTIQFLLPGAAPFTISPSSSLPPLAAPVVIDATTQAGYVGSPIIELNGTGAGAGAVGLRVTGSGGCTIRGLAINRFGADGIRLDSAKNVIQGNYIGTDVTGTLARGNGLNGVFVLGSATNVIGGTNLADRNVISGHNDTGVYVLNGAGNIIQGNYIGLNAAGNAELGNTNHGITLYNAPGNTIGGTVPGARNVIAGNYGSGLNVNLTLATGNLIQGNYIGVNAAGIAAVGNSADGITLNNAPGNIIGGTNTGGGNVISGNGQVGIFLNGAGARGNLIAGNLIGTDGTGTGALGNAFAGVTLFNSVSNRIGDGMSEARNVISGNRHEGVFLSTSSLGNRIRGNFIGIAANGSTALGNGASGVALNGAAANRIGGAAAGEGNIISGNTNMGVWLTGGSASNNLVQGNFIGTDASGLTAVKNGASGVQVESPANQIGGSNPGAGNVISGNGYIGVWLLNSNAVGNAVRGNLIGTAAGGMTGLGNSFGGIGLTDAANNEIGGLTVAERNLISANGFPANNGGVFIIGAKARGNRFYGNFIGTDISGQIALANCYEGIYISGASSNVIGSELAGGGNLISGNGLNGITLTNTSCNQISGNRIGTQADGVSPLGNKYFGIEVNAGCSTNTIGGLNAGAGNTIAWHGLTIGGGRAGIRIRSFSTNNAVLGNSIFSNASLGIAFSGFSPTANDGCDADTGGNMQQNFPVLTQAYSGANVGVRGTLTSAANTTFRLQFFASPSCDASGNGEGSVYLGDKLVNTGPACSTSFVVTLPGPVAAGQVITATATDPANNTSEFSACLPVLATPRLNLSPVGSDQVSLTWTNTAPGFVLKETSDLTPPINWTTVTNVPAVGAGQFTVTLTRQPGNWFYLLNFE